MDLVDFERKPIPEKQIALFNRAQERGFNHNWVVVNGSMAASFQDCGGKVAFSKSINELSRDNQYKNRFPLNEIRRIKLPQLFGNAIHSAVKKFHIQGDDMFAYILRHPDLAERLFIEQFQAQIDAEERLSNPITTATAELGELRDLGILAIHNYLARFGGVDRVTLVEDQIAVRLKLAQMLSLGITECPPLQLVARPDQFRVTPLGRHYNNEIKTGKEASEDILVARYQQAARFGEFVGRLGENPANRRRKNKQNHRFDPVIKGRNIESTVIYNPVHDVGVRVNSNKSQRQNLFEMQQTGAMFCQQDQQLLRGLVPLGRAIDRDEYPLRPHPKKCEICPYAWCCSQKQEGVLSVAEGRRRILFPELYGIPESIRADGVRRIQVPDDFRD